MIRSALCQIHLHSKGRWYNFRIAAADFVLFEHSPPMRHMSKSECWAVKSDNSGDGSWYSSCNVHALLCLLRSGWCASDLDNMQRWSFSAEVEHFFFTVTFSYITIAHFLFIMKVFFCTSGGVRVRMRVVKGPILPMFRSETFLSLAERWTLQPSTERFVSAPCWNRRSAGPSACL